MTVKRSRESFILSSSNLFKLAVFSLLRDVSFFHYTHSVLLFKQHSIPLVLCMGQTSWLMKGVYLQKKSVRDHHRAYTITLRLLAGSVVCCWSSASCALGWFRSHKCTSLVSHVQILPSEGGSMYLVLDWTALYGNLLEKENRALLRKVAWFGQGVEWAKKAIGMGLQWELEKSQWRMQVDLGTLKSTSMVGLPIG